MSNNMYPLVVQEVIEETPLAKSFVLEIPDQLKTVFEYQSGQYITVVYGLQGKEERRAYSIASAPHENQLKIGVKRIKNGLVSNHICDTVQVGDTMQIMAPEGRFTHFADPDRSAAYYFFAAGSGITPIISHIKSILEKEPLSSIYLLYGNKTKDHAMYLQELESMQSDFEGQLFIHFCYSQVGKKGLFGRLFGGNNNSEIQFSGRINDTNVDRFLALYPRASKPTFVFICGPEDMPIRLPEYLYTTYNFEKDAIFTESFGMISVDDVAQESVEGALLKAELDGQTIEIKMDGTGTILEQLIQSGHQPPYSCGSGACSSCMAKIQEGEVSMDVSHSLDKEDIEMGYILTCQARPTTKKVHIKYV